MFQQKMAFEIKWWSAALVLVILLFGIGDSLYTYDSMSQEMQTEIQGRVETIAQLLPRDDLQQLTGTAYDLKNPAYYRVKGLMYRARGANQDARFVYLLGKTPGGSVFFYSDSELPTSADYSPPGQLYGEAPGVISKVFDAKMSGTQRYSDRWGAWMSGFAPINDNAGNVMAVVGMDIPAEIYILGIWAHVLIPVSATIFALLIVIAVQFLRARESRYTAQRIELLSVASHEIRTPLTGIKWALDAFLKENGATLKPDAKEMLDAANMNCTKIIIRINDLLSAPVLEEKGAAALHKENIVVRPVLDDIVSVLGLSARSRGVTLVVDPTVDGSIIVSADKEQLHSIFFNLITNAIKYTRENTQIFIAYRRDQKAHVFSIADQGEGISEEDRTRIFEGYFRSESARKSGQQGTGIGLYLVKEAVLLHGGEITVTSEKDKGTTFYVSLPL